MSRIIITLLSVCVMISFAGAPVPAHAECPDIPAAKARSRTGLLPPDQRERLLKIFEAKKSNPRTAVLLPDTDHPDDIDLLVASMCHVPYSNDPDAVLVCYSARDTYPGTGDPEPFLSLLFSGPRLWVLGMSAIVLTLEALARLAALMGARTSLVRLTSRAT